MRHETTLPALCFICVVLVTVRDVHAEQQAAIYYVYDQLNRLTAVIDQQGSVATYTYDAVGNILAIERFDGIGIPGPVGITLVSPGRGKVGTPVQIFGKGFSSTPSENGVGFNGTPATVTTSDFNRIVTSVPDGAVTGLITVTTPLGSAASPTGFRVPGAITVSPTVAKVFTRRTQQFAAIEVGNSPPTVAWSVNGIIGGNATAGTISSEGLYTAPAAIPSPATITITATNTEDDRLSASASVTIEAAPDILVIAAGVSVQLAAPSPSTSVTTAVSAQPAPASAFVAARATSASVAPVIVSVSPTSGARGSSLAITIIGSGLAGGSALTFLRNNAADASITATDLSVNADGTQARATVVIASGAAVGARVVQISTPEATATAAGTGGNVFTVQ